jgi:hypothetical protein
VVTRLLQHGAMTTAGERSGVLVVRAWIEGDPPQLKARLTHTIDLTQFEPSSATVSSAKEIHYEIDRWLEALQTGPPR